MVPLFSLFHTDRLFFLINFIPYLLLPGIIFSVFSHLGISKRISWWWMWVLPCGYCYILQAASVGNDSFATIYLLAALHYLFQRQNFPRNLALSCLSIALMTGVKASSLPLVLPWLIALFFRREAIFKRIETAPIAITLVAAAAVSFLPTAVLNVHFTGDYAGDPNNNTKFKLSNPVSGVIGNTLQLAKENLMPPLWPQAIDWVPKLSPAFRTKLLHDFPRLDLRAGEMQVEEGAGIGLFEILFTGLFLVGGIAARATRSDLVVPRTSQALWVTGAGLVALLAYSAKMGAPPASRLIAAFYPLVIGSILAIAPLDGRVVRRQIFRWVGLLTMLSALPLVILCPARPLISVQFASDILARSGVPAALVDRFNQVYRVYSTRFDAFRDLTSAIPPSERVVGFLQIGDDPEASLWRPFGTRKVIEVTPVDSEEDVKTRGIRFVVISQEALTYRYHMTIADLAAKWSATIASEKQILLKAHRGPEAWYLLRLPDDVNSGQ